MEERAAEFGETFQALDDEPEIPEHLLLYWQAFWDIHTDRPMGLGGAGSVTFTAIDRYASRHGIEGDQFERLSILIRRMDAAYLKWQGERRTTSGT